MKQRELQLTLHMEKDTFNAYIIHYVARYIGNDVEKKKKKP